MKVARYGAAAVLFAATGGIAEAQLPGLPSIWQTGMGYFVGPFGSSSNVFCTDIEHALKWGYSWNAFLTPIAANDATPSGYTYAGLGGACGSPGGQSTAGAANLPQSGNPSNPGGTFDNLLYRPPAPPNYGGPAGPGPVAFYILPSAPPPPPPEEPPVPSGPTSPPPTIATPPVLNPHVTPEPATWLLLGTGLIGIVGFVALRATRV